MTVSLLIPVYKGSRTLEAALQSVLDQSIFPDEVIIGDDTPPSDKREVQKIKKIVERFQRKTSYPVIFIKNKVNLGCQKNFQKLTNTATKDIVLYLAQDDIFSINAISIIKDAFQNNPDCGFLTRPYFWFYDDIKKPIRYVSPPNNKLHTIIPSVNELIKSNGNAQIDNAVSTIFGSIGQISGLAIKRKLIKTSFHKDIFPGHMYPIANIWKNHQGICIKDYIVAIGTETSQSRIMTGIYDDSPTEQWIRMFQANFGDSKYKKIFLSCIKHITTNYIGLIQIKNFSTISHIMKEIHLLFHYRPMNIISIRFWFFVLISIFIPAKVLKNITDWYKQNILSKTVPHIPFLSN